MSKKLRALQINGELRGLKIAKGVKNANHAQFADDTILLEGASAIIAEIFKEVLSIFLKASDGKINAVKTKSMDGIALPEPWPRYAGRLVMKAL